MNDSEVTVTKNGTEVEHIPNDAAVSYLTDSLTGILHRNYGIEDAKKEKIKEKDEECKVSGQSADRPGCT